MEEAVTIGPDGRYGCELADKREVGKCDEWKHE
jgi:hypothetical protein